MLTSLYVLLGIVAISIMWTYYVHIESYRMGVHHGRQMEEMDQRHARERAEEEDSDAA